MSLVAFLTTVVRILREAEVPFMLTGSLAAAFYGTPRATQDIDLVIEPTPEQVERLVSLITAEGLYVSREVALEAFKSHGQFNAIDPETGWKADLIVRKDRSFSESEFARRQRTTLLGVEVALTSLEDLIIAKLEWSEMGDSELQRRDIADLIDVDAELDLAYIDKWAEALGLTEAWRKIRRG